MKWLSGKVLAVQSWRTEFEFPSPGKAETRVSLEQAVLPVWQSLWPLGSLSDSVPKVRWRVTKEDTDHWPLTFIFTRMHTQLHLYTESKDSEQNNRHCTSPLFVYFRTDCQTKLPESSRKAKLGKLCSVLFANGDPGSYWPDLSLTSAKMETCDLLASLLVFGGSVPYLMMSSFTIVSHIVWWFFKVFFI